MGTSTVKRKMNSKIDTNKEGAPDTDDKKIVTIGKMNAGNMYRVQGKTVLAIVDSRYCSRGNPYLRGVVPRIRTSTIHY